MGNKNRKGNFFHVTHDNTKNQWHVKEVGGRELKSSQNKEEAIKEAEKLAKKVEIGHVVIHDEHGRFQSFEHFEQ